MPKEQSNRNVLAGLDALPAQFAGTSGWELAGRLGSIYLATVAVIALRRNFRRGGASGAD